MSETDVDLVDAIVEAAADRGDNMLVEDLVVLLTRHDPMALESDAYGVSKERVLAYAEALPSGERLVTTDDVREAFSERTVESDEWVGGETLYAVDEGHVSRYPREWHEALEGEDDVRRFAEVIIAETSDSEAAFDRGGHGTGIPEGELLSAVSVLGTLSWEDAKREVERLREEGVFAEDVDQHPDASIRLADVDHD